LAKGMLGHAYHHRCYKLESADGLAGSMSWKKNSNGVWNPIQCHKGISVGINICGSVIQTLLNISTCTQKRFSMINSKKFQQFTNTKQQLTNFSAHILPLHILIRRNWYHAYSTIRLFGQPSYKPTQA